MGNISFEKDLPGKQLRETTMELKREREEGKGSKKPGRVVKNQIKLAQLHFSFQKCCFESESNLMPRFKFFTIQ